MLKKLPEGKVLRVTARCVELTYKGKVGDRKAVILVVLDNPPKWPYQNSFKVAVPASLGEAFMNQDIDITVRLKKRSSV